MGLQAPQPLQVDHNSTDFDCGDHGLNHWLRQRALANQTSGATRAIVVCGAGGDIRAFIAPASGDVAVKASPGRFRRNMPDPIPVVALTRALLADGLERVLQPSEQIGVRGLLVHAVSPAARAFYLPMGFEPSPLDSSTLMVRHALLS